MIFSIRRVYRCGNFAQSRNWSKASKQYLEDFVTSRLASPCWQAVAPRARKISRILSGTGCSRIGYPIASFSSGTINVSIVDKLQRRTRYKANLFRNCARSLFRSSVGSRVSSLEGSRDQRAGVVDPIHRDNEQQASRGLPITPRKKSTLSRRAIDRAAALRFSGFLVRRTNLELGSDRKR